MKKLVNILGVLAIMVMPVIAQETTIKTDSVTKVKKTYIELKEGANPDVYIDGKKYDPEILDMIDLDKIAKMDVIKGDEAMKKYNTQSVILITSKAKEDKNVSKVVIRNTGEDTGSGAGTPLIIIDGKKSDKQALEALDPENILSVSVVKGEQAISEYNSEAGVILVKTKGKK